MQWILFSSLNGHILKMNSRKILGLFFIVLLIIGYTEYNSNDQGKEHLIKRIESKHGIHTIEVSHELNIGRREYELINID